ncbi:decaprenyl-phosphate phosphoribosyltransferase [Pectinatus haikarae]|uniref:4-hydroxybenzoate polyprenyltransferase n=1 Tax=Pectinatus haikarae TaxID=349096 RepID=A0ABT9Y445_9FIRM|nr:decaprenyl-phosphate phosphoribosyltransferase [Pectinatus haikarae]MDQ0202595.1 4-hydroxybenzoate polyprenyltransferase [Pectinatus haikarae]
MIKLILKEMRINQYTKNLLVFAAPLFAGRIFNEAIFLKSVLIFFAFSFTSSIVYIFNDIIDKDKDSLHPQKCKRPIASKQLSVPMAVLGQVILVIIIIFIIVYAGKYLALILSVYVIINLLYSVILKHKVILDIMCIAIGFVLRAFAGVIAVFESGMTNWFILCVFMLSLFLALSKRRHELELFKCEKERQRKVLHFYSIPLIDQLITIVSAMTITSYALFATEQNSVTYSHSYGMMITIPLVVYGLFRYLYLVHVKNLGGAPEDVLLHDKHILMTVMLYVICIIFARNF